MNLLWALGASGLVSLISLLGIFSLLINEKFLKRILVLLIGFAAGGLIGGAFLHLLPEALEGGSGRNIFSWTILGFVAFFILEKYFYWRHCHEGICDVHAFTYLNLIGDGIHNFTDGLVIGVSFMVNIQFGIITTSAIIFHEIPQEIGDFGILVYGGFGKAKALFYNFLSALMALVGAVLGHYLTEGIENFSPLLLAFTAGGFVYISSCDLIPELHRQPNNARALVSMFAFLAGIIFMFLAKLVH